jgi:O-antigen ligase
MNTAKTDLPFLKTTFSKSIAGFFAALLLGALIPRTVQFLVRKVLMKSMRDFFVLVLAGWLTDRIVHLVVDSKNTEIQK